MGELRLAGRSFRVKCFDIKLSRSRRAATLCTGILVAIGFGCNLLASGNIPQTRAQTTSSAVSLTKAVDKTTANPGDILTYTLSYRNTSSTPVTHVRIQDVLPPQVIYTLPAVQSSPAPEYDPNSRTLSWQFDSVPASGSTGSSGEISFKAQLLGGSSSGLLSGQAAGTFAPIGIVKGIGSALSSWGGPGPTSNSERLYVSYSYENGTADIVSIDPDSSNYTVHTFPDPTVQSAWALTKGPDNQMYIGTVGKAEIFRLNPQTDEFVKIGRPSST